MVFTIRIICSNDPNCIHANAPDFSRSLSNFDPLLGYWDSCQILRNFRISQANKYLSLIFIFFCRKIVSHVVVNSVEEITLTFCTQEAHPKTNLKTSKSFSEGGFALLDFSKFSQEFNLKNVGKCVIVMSNDKIWPYSYTMFEYKFYTHAPKSSNQNSRYTMVVLLQYEHETCT